jgi:membrane associated rhomboid family serine protease
MFFLWPIYDELKIKQIPYVNYTLIAINCMVFLLFSFQPEYDTIVGRFGFIPAQFSWISLFTSLFLHGNIMHLVGNMWYLYLLGDNLEDRWGSLFYTGFYFLSGIAATLFYILLSKGESQTIPLIGASGAIAGVLGAYAVLFPKSKITFWYWYFILIRIGHGTFQVYAFLWLAFWFLQQLFGILFQHASSIAFAAHIGGFLFGMGVGISMRYYTRYRFLKNIREGTDALFQMLGIPPAHGRTFEETIDMEERRTKILASPDSARNAALYLESISLYPGFRVTPKEAFRIAGILKRMGYIDAAIDAFKKSVIDAPFAEYADDALFFLGKLYLEKGDRTMAKNCLLHLILHYPYSEYYEAAKFSLMYETPLYDTNRDSI